MIVCNLGCFKNYEEKQRAIQDNPEGYDRSDV